MKALDQVDEVEHSEEGHGQVQVAILTRTEVSGAGDREGVEVHNHLRHLLRESVGINHSVSQDNTIFSSELEGHTCV